MGTSQINWQIMFKQFISFATNPSPSNAKNKNSSMNRQTSQYNTVGWHTYDWICQNIVFVTRLNMNKHWPLFSSAMSRRCCSLRSAWLFGQTKKKTFSTNEKRATHKNREHRWTWKKKDNRKIGKSDSQNKPFTNHIPTQTKENNSKKKEV